MGKETSQRLGIDGVQEVKEWLEATTRFAFTFTVYDNEAMCTVSCLNGDKKALDLVGTTTGARKRPVIVESKKYSSVGGQAKEFKRFLAIAYSSTAFTIADLKSDPQRDFLWVTSRPFSQRGWKNLLNISYMRACLKENEDLLDGNVVDDDLLAKVASRTWVMVVQEKQVGLRLSVDELSVVNSALIRGGYQR